MKYFVNVKTLEELKKEYRKLAKKYHPDLNKDKDTTEIMQEINREYEILFNQLKNENKHTKNENVNTFRDIINTLIKFENITIDIVGSWLWVYGKGTYSIKNKLLNIGFQYSPKHKKFYYAEYIGQNKPKKYKNKMKYDDIIFKYGKKTVKEDKQTYKYIS